MDQKNVLLISGHNYLSYSAYKKRINFSKEFSEISSLALMQIAVLIPDNYNITILNNPTKTIL